ncbi:xanthine dehydrogenase family protein subunit M [Actinomycetospora sp. TBRC 11914]|uniref:FAD binding domain-containing protein n=1 Tax=Actinomycetospora sp. TBRC 11914 TaxID=2729387 RepID=UPI00145FC2D8|nr:xanthine dehydrogenase family protein subunit M [Actinomycetospora sp. TBRC 11914]NMO90410.1 xanthine dehydrogenase family protein subunit M [Actinomycetospora sp. TBRC 11914]
MRPFTYARPDDAEAAVATVGADPGAVFLAGGTNLLDHLKLGVATPSSVVDLGRVTSTAITELDDGGDGDGDGDGDGAARSSTTRSGLRIGAGALNSDVAAHPLVRRRYPALAQALLAGASGQLRNMATTGGNLLQRTRCVYFADTTTPCTKRDLTQPCSAREGWTRYHAILGASEHCLATHPSDMAVALVALDATVQVLGADGTRTLPVAELHRLPGDDPTHDTVLRHGELITAVDLPASPIAARSAYRKVRDRASYAFALVSVAAALGVREGTVADVRIALGGVAPKPWRATRAEDALRGAPATDESYRAAARAELADADPVESPLGGNRFKLDLVVGALTDTLRRLTEEQHS